MNPVTPNSKTPLVEPSAPVAPPSNLVRNLYWFFLFLAVVSAALGIFWKSLLGDSSLNRHWADVFFLGTVTVCLALNLARQLPWPNVLASVGIIACFGGATMLVGVQTSMPFGPFRYNHEFSPLLFNLILLPAPLIWVAMILSARGVARLILRPWRKVTHYGFWLIGLTAVLVMLTDLALEPFGSFAHHYWNWQATKIPVTWYGASVVNFLAWGFIATLMLGFTTPLLINKSPSRKNVPDFHPLVVWLLMLVVFSVPMGALGAWRAVIVNGALALVAGGLALAGSRW